MRPSFLAYMLLAHLQPVLSCICSLTDQTPSVCLPPTHFTLFRTPGQMPACACLPPFFPYTRLSAACLLLPLRASACCCPFERARARVLACRCLRRRTQTSSLLFPQVSVPCCGACTAQTLQQSGVAKQGEQISVFALTHHAMSLCGCDSCQLSRSLLLAVWAQFSMAGPNVFAVSAGAHGC